MNFEYRIARVKQLGELRGEIDVDKIDYWVDTGIVLEQEAQALSAMVRSESPIRFATGVNRGNVWTFAEASTARLEVAADRIRRALHEEAREIVIDGLELLVFSRSDPVQHPFRLRLALFAGKPALPRIPPVLPAKTINLEKDAAGSEVEILALEFVAPEWPRLPRPAFQLRVEAQAQEARGVNEADLLRGLEFQLLKAADLRLFQPLSEGRNIFGLEYDSANRRFDPEGLIFALGAETLLRAVDRKSVAREVHLRFAFYAGESKPFATAELPLRFTGTIADRIVVRWRRATMVDKPVVHILESTANFGELPALDFELLPDGSYSPTSVGVQIRVEPKTALVRVRARLDGVDHGEPPVRPASTGRGEWILEAPLGRWFASLDGARGFHAPAELEFEIAIEEPNLEKAWTVVLRSELRRAPPRPKWVACVDFGASSTAIWLGRAEGEMPGRPLALGAWLDTIDRGRRSANPDEATLIPSYVGLDSSFHLRARFDAHSLGDLSLALPGRPTAERRLKTLDHAYDVSAPFPSRSLMRRRFEPEKRPKCLGAIVYELKRAVLKPPPPPHLETAVMHRRRRDEGIEDTQTVDFSELMEDVFAELGSHVALRALARESNGDLREVAEARDSGEAFLVVVTHPYGVVGRLAQSYHRAGERFANGFAPAVAREAAEHEIALVPEALAAAQFGVESYRRAGGDGPRSGEAIQFVTFDIGAGTFDACALEDRDDAQTWRLQQHFGVALGGEDLDGALVDLAAQLLKDAEGKPGFAPAFQLVTHFDERAAAERQLLGREVREAKAQLNRALETRGGAYEWRNGDLSICVGVLRDPGDQEAWPVIFRSDPPPREIRVGGQHWSLSLEASSTYSLELRLCIAPAYFSGEAARNGPIGRITQVLGEEFPRMALSTTTSRRKVVIVTGRTALWPPLFAAIRESARLAGAQMSNETPLSAREMKEAVVKGAVALAANPAQLAQAHRNVANPLAMLCFATDTGRGGSFTRSRTIRKIQLLPDADAGEWRVDVRDAFVIASVVPGLLRPEGREERLKFFERLRESYNVRPYIVLSTEIQAPLESEIGQYDVLTTGGDDRVELRFRPSDGASEGFVVSIQRQGRFFQ